MVKSESRFRWHVNQNTDKKQKKRASWLANVSAKQSGAERSRAEQSRRQEKRREEKRREDAYAYPIVCCMLHETRVYILYIEFNFSQTAGQNRAEYRRAEQSRAEQSKAK